MRRLKRANKILTKRLKLIHRPNYKHATSMVHTQSSDLRKTSQCASIEKCSPHHNFRSARPIRKLPTAVCLNFKEKRSDDRCYTVDEIVTQADCDWFPTLDYLIEQIPRSSQINESIAIAKKVQDNTADRGYQTSSSK